MTRTAFACPPDAPPSSAAVAPIEERDAFLERVLRVRDALPDGEEAALLYVNLDHFRATITHSGARSGQVLERVRELLQRRAAGTGDLGSLGLEEFGLLLPAPLKEAPLAVARELVAAIGAAQFSDDEPEPVRFTASIGVAPITCREQPLDEILCTADAAARAARSVGGNRAIAMRPHETLALADLKAVRTLPRLREALDEGRLVLYCQPIVPLRAGDGRLPAAEILSRLSTREGELLAPSEFLPIAERFRLTAMLDREVVERACGWIESRSQTWVDLDYLTVNLHPLSLADAEFTEWLVDRIAQVRFPAHRLGIEITESTAVKNVPQARRLFTQLRDTGCRIALDDFGSGYSSLTRFQDLPVDIIKLDGAFMRNIVDDHAARALVAWVCDLCRAADRTTVAEYCSTPDVLEVVRSLGLDYAQGHAVCEPFPLERLLPAMPPRLVAGASA